MVSRSAVPSRTPGRWSIGRSVGGYHAVLADVAGRVRRPRRGWAGCADVRPAGHGARRDRRRVGPARSAGPASRGPGGRPAGRRSAAHRVQALGYLFFVGDRTKTDLAYRSPSDEDAGGRRVAAGPARRGAHTRRPSCAWPRRPARVTGSPTSSSRAACCPRRDEAKAVIALADRFPEARITLDPNGGWLLDDAIRTCRGLIDVLAYAEDPVGPEGGFSGREVMAEFKRATGLPTATNMIATDWRELGHAIRSGAVDIPLADPHFWTMTGSVRVAQLCDAWGLTLGLALQQPLRRVAGDVHPRRRRGAGRRHRDRHPLDLAGRSANHQGALRDRRRLPRRVPDAPGLGVDLDDDAVAAAHELYLTEGLGARDDAIAMQYLMPGWTFDSKRPALASEADESRRHRPESAAASDAVRGSGRHRAVTVRLARRVRGRGAAGRSARRRRVRRWALHRGHGRRRPRSCG